MKVEKVLSSIDGKCNFCDSKTRYVYQVVGKSLAIRFCIKCATTFKKAITQK